MHCSVKRGRIRRTETDGNLCRFPGSEQISFEETVLQTGAGTGLDHNRFAPRVEQFNLATAGTAPLVDNEFERLAHELKRITALAKQFCGALFAAAEAKKIARLTHQLGPESDL